MYQMMANVLDFAAKNKWLFLSLPFLLITKNSYSLPSDKSQKIEFNAGSADINNQKHLGVFLNNVILDQGTTHIRAAKAITQGNEKSKLVKAIIYGDLKNQAHYWTTTDINKPHVHAYADIIYYYPIDHKIKLIGNAKIIQGLDSFIADKISYDTLEQRVISQSDNMNRTTIIFHPGKDT